MGETLLFLNCSSMVLNDDSYVVYDLKSGLVWHSIGGKYLSAKQQQTTASTTLTFLQQYE